MPDDLPDLPENLVQLQCDYEAARATATAYAERVTAERRELHPDPRPKRTVTQTDDGGKEVQVTVEGDPVWSAEQAALRNDWPHEQRDELQRLRDASKAALDALYSHPVVTAAMADGSWKKLHVQLKTAAEVPGWRAKSLS